MILETGSEQEKLFSNRMMQHVQHNCRSIVSDIADEECFQEEQDTVEMLQ